MKKRILIALVVLLALAATSVVWADPTTRVVDVDGTYDAATNGCDGLDAAYTSIQAAVNAASPSDTIIVCAGTYNEAVRVNKSLTLKGEPGATIKPDNTTPAYDNNRRCGVYVPYGPPTVDGVTIEGFEIDGTGGTVHCGILLGNSDNSIIRNNVIHDIKNEIGPPGLDVAGVGILIFGWGQGIDDALIESNTVYNTGRMGIFVGGMQSGSPWKFLVASNNAIKNNTVHHAWQGPTNDHGGAVQINGANNSLIEDNTIHDTGLNQYGIYIAGSASSTPNRILGNDIYSNNIGIRIWSTVPEVDLSPYSPGAPEVHFNNIYTNTAYGLENIDTDLALQIDAENNWWGHPGGPLRLNPAGKWAGPKTADRVLGEVDYHPWLHRPQ